MATSASSAPVFDRTPGGSAGLRHVTSRSVAVWWSAPRKTEVLLTGRTRGELVMTKNCANRFGPLSWLTFFRERGRFLRDETEVEAHPLRLQRSLTCPR